MTDDFKKSAEPIFQEAVEAVVAERLDEECKKAVEKALKEKEECDCKAKEDEKKAEKEERIPTKSEELNRVLGGGIVPGSLVFVLPLAFVIFLTLQILLHCHILFYIFRMFHTLS